MSKYVEFLNTISAVSGAKKTAEALQPYVHDPDIRRFLHVALDPSYNWFHSEIRPSEGTSHPYTRHQEDLEWFMYQLEEAHEEGMPRGADGRNWLADIYHQVNEAEQPLCHLIIERNLRAGCGAKTIKKVFGSDVVDVLPYMRCELAKHAEGKKKATYDHFRWEEGIHSELKADGMFCNAITKGDVLRSRQGTIIPRVHQLEPIYKAVKELGKLVGAAVDEINTQSQALGVQYNLADPVFHMELLVSANEDGVILYVGTKDEIEFAPNELLPREVSNGLINSLIKSGDPLPSGAVVHAQIWDVVAEDEWRAGKGTVQRVIRKQVLEHVLGENIQFKGVIDIIPSRIVYSYEEAAQHFAEVVAQGLEGTVIKTPDGLYRDGNSKDQLKMKVVFEVDLELLGFNEADQKGKYADMFGSLRLGTSDGKLEVSCSGMSVALRNDLFEAKDRLVAARENGTKTIITVSTNGLMKPTKHNDIYSLFLPRLAKGADGQEQSVRAIEMRLDKTEADTLEQVIDAYNAAIGLV